MARRKPAGRAPAIHKSATAFGNVTDDIVRQHASALRALSAKLRTVQQEIKTAWQTAEADGIGKTPLKAALKLLSGDPATADAYLRQFQQYTVQLGLFDAIEQWKQGEAVEANEASVDAAERALADA